MSFDLVVVAIDPNASDEQVRAMVRRCDSGSHVEGELDDRIVGFYESLRSHYPDFPPYDEDSPWMSTPLDVGIDHVSMQLSYSQRSDPALSLIDELARRYGLMIYDPQGDEVTRPDDVRIPPDPALVATWESLRAPES
ncbi:hypothetical protein SAMN05421812_1089 [Asanoa hainanensis]|uniref:Uncharacterized protein n=1 Tax=Asanoa hainanensis TaxID=560556 RepID=A0A239NA52_9ACTN|nr:hypothetical protein [Asanoa hainanensis]SNT51362.1 hypothetical protein SAMN05421812_1089 [Asanoa hainanensis]